MSSRRNKNYQLLVVLLYLGLVFLSGCSTKKQKLYQVGILASSNDLKNVTKGFEEKMGQLGYVKDKNIIYDFITTDNNENKMKEAAAKFVADKVDLIFAYSTANALGAKEAAKVSGIPVVFAISTIENNNLVDNVREPGGNITGVRNPSVEIFLKRLEILLEIVPNIERIWLAYKSGFPTATTILKVLEPAALSKGVTLVKAPVNNITEIRSDLESRTLSASPDIDAIMILPEPFGNSAEGWKIISEFATKYKIPIIGNDSPQTKQGAILTYVPELEYVGQLAASLTDKIFKGAPAGKISVVTPEAELRINYKISQELGLSISEGMLSQAIEIIR